MEATITLPSAWPGLERAGVSAANELAAERRQDERDALTKFLRDEFRRAMNTDGNRVPFAVVRTAGQIGGYINQPDAWIQVCVTAMTREDEASLELREVLDNARCDYVRTLKAAITARLFRDLTESVLSTLESADVAEALRDVLRHSQSAQVEMLRKALCDWYELAHAQIVAEMLTQ